MTCIYIYIYVNAVAVYSRPNSVLIIYNYVHFGGKVSTLQCACAVCNLGKSISNVLRKTCDFARVRTITELRCRNEFGRRSRIGRYYSAEKRPQRACIFLRRYSRRKAEIFPARPRPRCVYERRGRRRSVLLHS